VIVDDYSRYTWVHFLRSKDEAPAVIITFLKWITALLQSPVIIIRTDNDTEFKNQVLKVYFDSVGITHQMSSIRTPQQNGVVERRNRTLVEAARTMLIFSRAPLFLWAEAIATACFTQNRSIIHSRFNKTPYKLINSRKLDISFLHVFGALCYPKNDREDIRKLATVENVPPAQEPQVRQTSTTSTTIADNVPIPTNSSSHITNIPTTLQDVDELNPNAMIDGNTFVNPFATSSSNATETSSSQNVDPSNMHTKPDISFLYVFEALCYPKNDREDIGKLGTKGLPKFKYHKERLCPSYEQGKSKRASHPPKPVPNSRQRLHLLHMDFCGPMRIASINGKRIMVLFQSPVIIIRTDNGTEFKNQVLKVYFNSVGISHQMSSVRTPQQNGVVERRNRTLVEAARTMLILSRAPLFLWAKVIATACFTQNCSIIHRRFNKTPYELINGRKPDILFLYVFGALCYPKNDREDIGKLGAK
nr:retrovirus-related Pol polyprotein from transposon TNT 1-94 [Tanacetum cinerariifolium]